MRTPSFIVIGAQRCGTTSLWEYVRLHPEIGVPVKKEIHYFDHFYNKGIKWYEGKFHRCKERVIGEASPFYILHPRCPERIAKECVDVKLIVLLRNPVDRAYSHYQHEIHLPRAQRREHLNSFGEALSKEEQRIEGEYERLLVEKFYRSPPLINFTYKIRGVYVDQLRRWFHYFDKSRILIIQSEYFYQSTNKVLEEVWKFLDVSPFRIGNCRQYNNISYSVMSDGNRQYLEDYFRSTNEELRRFLKDKRFIGMKGGWI